MESTSVDNDDDNGSDIWLRNSVRAKANSLEIGGVGVYLSMSLVVSTMIPVKSALNESILPHKQGEPMIL